MIYATLRDADFRCFDVLITRLCCRFSLPLCHAAAVAIRRLFAAYALIFATPYYMPSAATLHRCAAAETRDFATLCRALLLPPPLARAAMPPILAAADAAADAAAAGDAMPMRRAMPDAYLRRRGYAA